MTFTLIFPSDTRIDLLTASLREIFEISTIRMLDSYLDSNTILELVLVKG